MTCELIFIYLLGGGGVIKQLIKQSSKNSQHWNYKYFKEPLKNQV